MKPLFCSARTHSREAVVISSTRFPNVFVHHDLEPEAGVMDIPSHMENKDLAQAMWFAVSSKPKLGSASSIATNQPSLDVDVDTNLLVCIFGK